MTVNVIAAGLLTAPAVVGSSWNALSRDHGLPPDPDCRRINGDIMIAPVPASLRSPDAAAPAMLGFVRPAILDDHPSGRDERTRRALVDVTLGTVFHLESGDLFARLVQAMNLVAATDDVDVLITTGGAHLPPDGFPSAGPRVRIESFVAQRKVLDRCRAVVCHAGSGTIVDAMTLGIPVVALPLGADQPDKPTAATSSEQVSASTPSPSHLIGSPTRPRRCCVTRRSPTPRASWRPRRVASHGSRTMPDCSS